MLRELLRRSVIMRLGFVLSAIVLLAWAGMTSALYIAARADGEAQAVNVAGQLRMQSYRIATHLLALVSATPAAPAGPPLAELVAGFERRLTHPALREAIHGAAATGSHARYETVARRWRTEIRPLLADLDRQLEPPAATGLTPPPPDGVQLAGRYLALLPDFVDQIDGMVKALEIEAQRRVRMLWLLEAIPLGLTFAIVLLVLYLSYRRLLAPLHRLLSCAEGLQRGNLALRAETRGNDEFALIGRTLNALSEDLRALYRDLEARVEEKTRELRHRTASLELLYRTVRRLNETAEPQRTFPALLDDLAAATGASGGLICLGARPGALAESHPSGSLRRVCLCRSCADCRAEAGVRVLELRDDAGVPHRVLSVPIADQNTRFGVLLLEFAQAASPEAWARKLAEAVADHVGIAMRMQARHDAERRLALLEERSVIARELHDSLAQSLSYLKIKTRRLETELARHQEPAAAALVGEIRAGLNDAYSELRSLLNTFRLRIDGRGLEGALATAVAEQARLSGIDMALEYRLPAGALDAHEEVHVLHIVREAIANVARHSGARRARISLDHAGAQVVVRVEDDGSGLPDEAPEGDHHGLAIMRERAGELGGRLRLARASAEGGTLVELRFVPRAAQATQATA
ncbi:type IV pili methyl-accepting chemotaxis transducer N-terminal domain-containing protein [Inmirania thermothiophila]|uniref:Sensor protein n=1 Tax=Inmirania thermothiophila TaxID=1750597 RepID=A0A3N1Y1L3_9GAMM|nr:type IV pili methyl-accepting chemotaxis transducer N-terminal domain-containing protein [Inmirania thermothiophila]ROR32418.1 two-component system nitrate/nitrite sensor histidine kinase NarX [Inmirania thermothiophila]